MALPFLETLEAASVGPAAASHPPLRLGIFTVTGGTVLESWKQKAEGPLTQFPSILRSLDFAREDLLMLSGLSHGGTSQNVNAHERCAYVHLTGAAKVGKEGGMIKAGISVDQHAAQ